MIQIVPLLLLYHDVLSIEKPTEVDVWLKKVIAYLVMP